MATPDYSKIWGANSPLAKYEFTEADYLRGWEFIGSMPPARTMFDAWMRKADEKMRWLYDNAFSENSLGGFLFWRLPDTAYFVGEKRALQDGPLDVYLECTIAGRTSKEQMKKLPQGAEIGKTFVDGTATWLVRQFATNAALAAHRKKTPLDHPDGSVLKRHLGFEVYDKGETYAKSEIDSRVNGKVSKSGDTMTGPLNFAENQSMRTCIFPSHYFHNLFENGDTVYIHAFPSHPAPAKPTKFEFRTANGEQGKWTTHTLSSKGFITPTLWFGESGYIGNATRDTGNAIEGNGGANLNIGSWWGIGFYDQCNKRYTGSMDLRSGDWRTTGSMNANTFYAGNWFRALGDTGLHFESHGGGWHMTDNDWIRAYNGKNIYTAGKIRCDAGFEGSLRGTADNANKLGDKSLQWVLEQIKNSIVKIAILTGTVAHGGTIPLPNGFLESQCKWTVSPATIVDFATGGDLKGFGCTVDEHRKVSCVAEGHGDSVNTIANYIIIGVK